MKISADDAECIYFLGVVDSMFLKLKLEEVFTPDAFVSGKTPFSSRPEEERLLEQELRSKGTQIVVYGEFGVGKTSLSLHVLERMGRESVRVPCENIGSGQELYQQILDRYSSRRIQAQETNKSTGVTGGGNIGVGLPLFKAGIGGEASTTTQVRETTASWADKISPLQVVEVISSANKVCILDDFEKLAKGVEEEVHTSVSHLGKVSSDFSTDDRQPKLIVVGKADSAHDIVRDLHASRFASVHVPLMKDEELLEIIEIGAQKTGYVYPKNISDRIVKMACGFPKFVHLLAYYSGCAARSKNRREVSQDDFVQGLLDGIKKLEPEFEHDYYRAIRSNQGSKEFHKNIIHAMAGVDTDRNRYTLEQILSSVRREMNDSTVEIGQIRGIISSLQKPDRQGVLMRWDDSQGVYGFTNPMFKSYVRMRLRKKDL